MTTKKIDKMNFETAIEELEQLVEQLENGDLPLDEALKSFERGIALARVGQTKLNDAEQRISILLKESDNAPLAPFKFVSHTIDEAE